MTNTTVISTWLDETKWTDGWNIIQRGTQSGQPAIWVVDPSEANARLMGQYANILSREEILRSERFHQPAHATRFKVAHALLRLLLANSTGTSANTVHFEKGHHNKPLLSAQASSAMEFNLSYTAHKVMIGTAPHSIGIDIEWLQRPLDIEDMLTACFSTNEIAYIKSRTNDMLLRFYTLWTRKEAILKLTGEGIGEHLPHFEVLDGICEARKEVIGGQPPDRIFLYSFCIGDDFIGCVATPMPVNRFFLYRI
ncbi:4'-phosphopantetheinyl transferase [Parapedobacter luteus]|uniref:4'-phosphopantetheinyl transferase n=1 Tax=Parapedobacter luteus TaxID=623280 RepID=A0A1T5C6Y4_9SPHI|nr:4'-phosphopantetheinyl transferase superfamily protein [Parapedobacter luteus]SKB55185.1 4'-phosphopantetheinyl transferase [Parapedobacter luteus]